MLPSTNIQDPTSPPQNTSTSFYEQKPLHSKEIEVQNLLGQAALQFNPQDPRPKLLYLMAAHDDTNAFPINKPHLDIETHIKGMSQHSSTNKVFADKIKTLREHQEKAIKGDRLSTLILKATEAGINENDHGMGRFLKVLDKNFDLRFKVISSAKEMCIEILAAAKINNFVSIILSAHGLPNAIIISDSELIYQDTKNQDFLFVAKYINVNGLPQITEIVSKIGKSCFSGLPSKVKVTLLSCQTGYSPTGIASTISRLLQLEVWAPRDVMTAIKTELSAGIHPIPTFWNASKSENAFFDDHACKFSPDGSSKHGRLHAKVLPTVKYYAPLVVIIISFVTLFFLNKDNRQ